MQSSFLFTVCQVGAEKALKDELARDYPDLRFAFSRPGFVTFKAQSEVLAEDFELRSVFARAYGLSLGEKLTGGELDRMAQGVWEKARELSTAEGRPVRLHVFERDQHAPGEEPQGFQAGDWAEIARKAILRNKPHDLESLVHADPLAEDSDLVLDVICVEEMEWWLGVHRHDGTHSSAPGGAHEIETPEEAPSRAFLKLEEALLWSGAPVREGDQAVEIGSAPGGASYALLLRGVNVVGIDPGEMDPRVLLFRKNVARFKHIARPVATVPREELPESVEWLLVDMNVEPRIALTSVDRLGTRMSDSLLGIVLTLKLNQWSFAKEIPSWIEHVKAMGMVRVRAAQLAHNRREICVVGLTSKGVSRLARERR